MATLTELHDLFNDGGLIKKIAAALIIKANQTLTDIATATVSEKKWAASVFADPSRVAHTMIKAVLAANAGADVVDIQNATDVQIQAKVDAAAQLFIDAGV